jgi:hypothetical protein
MAEFVPLGGNTETIKKDTIDIKAAIQDLKMKLDEAGAISIIEGKSEAGFYDLFRSTHSIDMANTTANIAEADAIFEGSKVLKMLPQYFDNFSNVQLSIYDKLRTNCKITAKNSDTEIVVLAESPIKSLALASGDTIYCRGETFTVTNVVEV